jgi:hypothetical protein
MPSKKRDASAKNRRDRKILMAVVTFDTLKFVKTLEAAGVPPQQAEAFSSAVRDSREMAELATKADVGDLCKDMQLMEQRLEAKIESLK